MLGKKYYIHRIHENFESLEKIAPILQNSNYIYPKTYFDNTGKPQILELRTRFSGFTLEDGILQGESSFETDQQSTDLDGKYTIARQKNSIKFFIALEPFSHVIFIADKGGLATRLSKRMNTILSQKKGSSIPRYKLTDIQILKFLQQNPYKMKSVFRGTKMDGISTMGLFGSDVEKPIEVELITKYLTEHKSIKVLLTDYGWTVWLSKNTGAITSLDNPEELEFVDFIHEKILTL